MLMGLTRRKIPGVAVVRGSPATRNELPRFDLALWLQGLITRELTRRHDAGKHQRIGLRKLARPEVIAEKMQSNPEGDSQKPSRSRARVLIADLIAAQTWKRARPEQKRYAPTGRYI
jgi:hypothetical protein